MDPRDAWIKIGVAAKVTGKSKRTIHKLITRDNLKSAQEDGQTIVILSELEAAIYRTPTRGGDTRKPKPVQG